MAVLLLAVGLVGCPDATEVATQCVQSDLVAQCPAGTAADLSADASALCRGGGSGGYSPITQAGTATVSAACASVGSCRVVCEFLTPCSCGIASITRDAVVCSECNTSCGDGRCEGVERPTCEGVSGPCMPCAEDCSGATCGDGDCTAQESPTTCPQDCATLCEPNSVTCDGTTLLLCSADGSRYTPTNCAAAGMTCSNGQCVLANACGNGLCESGETATNCPQDCATACAPNSVRCDGVFAVRCGPTGQEISRTNCDQANMVCNAGQCYERNVCGNGVCEANETGSTCAADCEIVCGNGRCEAGEELSCPRDCIRCGNNVCELGEQQTCPQDCDIGCEANTRVCEGNTLVVCDANGQIANRVECGRESLICSNGQCVAEAVCGNGRCEAGETPENCADCRSLCGNGTCDAGETTSCPRDCAVCGNGTCEAEEQTTCPQDCGVCLPNARSCAGAILLICAANGQSEREVDCGASGLVCARGECVLADVCGNGACEAGEAETCAADCAEVCGNNHCGPGENFGNCPADCEPQCGDGSCDRPQESSQSCPRDCLATCGNGVCDPGETRERCRTDCGFCGDGVCQDGYESASDFPPVGIEPCRTDCVVSTCRNNSDCDDGFSCTTNTCVAGECVYTPDNLVCGSNRVCLPRAGCCDDADGDGFASMACGGSDCNDNDRNVKPGAFEPCGSGDRNCSGDHRPALSRDVVQITRDLTNKRGLGVASDGQRYLLVWRANPAGAATQQFQFADMNGALQGSPGVLTRVVDEVASPDGTNDNGRQAWPVYNTAIRRWQVLWLGSDSRVFVNWVEADGSLVRPEPTPLSQDYRLYTVFNLGPMLMRYRTGYLFAYYNTSSWTYAFQISDAGGITTAFSAVGPRHLASAGGTNVAFLGTTHVGNPQLSVFDENATSIGTYTPQSQHWRVESRVFFDGEALAVFSDAGAAGIQWERILLSGERVGRAALTGTQYRLLDALHRPQQHQVGLLLGDGSNLYFMIADDEGNVVLPPGLIAAGQELNAPQLVWNGNEFTIFWGAKVGTLHQLFTTRITCE